MNRMKLEIAKTIAQEAGQLAVKLRGERSDTFVKSKGLQDFVTIADNAVEELIRKNISAQFPDDTFLGEEAGSSGSGKNIWVVDPIDGTSNFMRGLPDWAVSIAYCAAGSIQFGVIFAPDHADLAWAMRGEGAFVNGAKIHVSSCSDCNSALLMLGRSRRQPLKDYLTLVKRVTQNGFEYRRNGSAAVSLLNVATGCAEGFYEAHLNSWDALAGILIVNEAGGSVSHSNLMEFLEQESVVFASNGVLEEEISRCF